MKAILHLLMIIPVLVFASDAIPVQNVFDSPHEYDGHVIMMEGYYSGGDGAIYPTLEWFQRGGGIFVALGTSFKWSENGPVHGELAVVKGRFQKTPDEYVTGYLGEMIEVAVFEKMDEADKLQASTQKVPRITNATTDQKAVEMRMSSPVICSDMDELERLVYLLDTGEIAKGADVSLLPLVKPTLFFQNESDGLTFQHSVIEKHREFEVFIYIYGRDGSWVIFCAGKRDLRNMKEFYYFCDYELLEQYIKSIVKTSVKAEPGIDSGP